MRLLVPLKTMTIRQESAQLRRLKWVETVKVFRSTWWDADTYGFVIKTKPGALWTYLTHTIQNRTAGGYDYLYGCGKKLPQKVKLVLPSYYIKLYPPAQGRFLFALAAEPKKRAMAQIGVIPQYQSVVSKERYGSYYTPCLGHAVGDANSGNTYLKALDWIGRATEAVIYLQGATPHYTNQWYATAFAYRLGLVGKEMLEKEPAPAETKPRTNVQAATTAYFGATGF